MKAWLARTGLWWLLASAGGVLLAWIAPRIGRGWRMRLGIWRLKSGRGSVADATLLYRRMLKLLKRRGFEKPAFYTPTEFARTLPSRRWARSSCSSRPPTMLCDSEGRPRLRHACRRCWKSWSGAKASLGRSSESIANLEESVCVPDRVNGDQEQNLVTVYRSGDEGMIRGPRS